MSPVEKLVEFLKVLVTWWFFVEPWQKAIRLRCGKNLKLCEPGAHFKVPFIDSVYMHNIRRMVTYCSAQTVSTIDGRVFSISCSVSFEIADVLKLHTTVHDAESVIGQDVAQACARFVHSRTGAGVNPDSLQTELRAIDLCKYGLCNVDVCVNNFAETATYRLIQDGFSANWRDERLKVQTAFKI